MPDAVVAKFASRGEVRRIGFPTEEMPRWTSQGEDQRHGIQIDDRTGAFVDIDLRRQGPVMRWMRDLHEGDEGTGLIWRLIVVLAGLTPAILGVTGVTMWLRSRRWRAATAARSGPRRG